MRLVDYVVVHELVHLRNRGHGRDYWQALGRVMPGLRAAPGGPTAARITIVVVAFFTLMRPWMSGAGLVKGKTVRAKISTLEGNAASQPSSAGPLGGLETQLCRLVRGSDLDPARTPCSETQAQRP